MSDVTHHMQLLKARSLLFYFILTSNNDWIRFIETHASVTPFKTHGNALSGPISIFNKAILVNTVAAVS